ncbi:hypothetical protein MNBD_NITROSPINAE03-1468 [hydrothermal vent metagenome]|uniref:Major facilitator superfamily (MFS) profile domain-containing protein n=1 Tax=hydrothermal vent metagenome TaxID=652676 RepID=A0A3B1CIY8_9ZZZZ
MNSTANRMSAREKRVIAVSSAAHFLTHLYILIFPAIVMPMSREMGLAISDVFPIGFMMYLLYGALALPAGYLSDRWSKIAMLKVCVFGMSFSAFAASYSSSVSGFTLSLAMLGLFCGLYHPAGLGLIASETGKQGAAHGINGIFGNIGIAAAPLSSGIILLTLNWRWAYWIAGLVGLAILALIFSLTANQKLDNNPHLERSLNKNRDGRLKYFAVLCACIVNAGLIYRANLTALPSYFEIRASSALETITGFTGSGAVDATSGASAILVSSLFIFSIAGQYAGGWVADNFDLRKAYFLFHLASVPFILGMALSFEIPLYVTAAGMVFFNLGMLPIENSLLSKFIPERWVSTGYGIKFTLTFGIGSFALYQVAFLEKLGGLQSVYVALTAQALLLASIAAFLIYFSRSIGRITNTREDIGDF